MFGNPRRASLTDHIVPGSVALSGWNPDRACESDKVRNAHQDGVVAFDPEYHLVALLDSQGVAHRLWNGYLSLRSYFRCNIHLVSLQPNIK